jgi:hypothetical protein
MPPDSHMQQQQQIQSIILTITNKKRNLQHAGSTHIVSSDKWTGIIVPGRAQQSVGIGKFGYRGGVAFDSPPDAIAYLS